MHVGSIKHSQVYNEKSLLREGSASESTLVGLLSARNKAITDVRAARPDLDDSIIMSKLVAYGSDQVF